MNHFRHEYGGLQRDAKWRGGPGAGVSNSWRSRWDAKKLIAWLSPARIFLRPLWMTFLFIKCELLLTSINNWHTSVNFSLPNGTWPLIDASIRCVGPQMNSNSSEDDSWVWANLREKMITKLRGRKQNFEPSENTNWYHLWQLGDFQTSTSFTSLSLREKIPKLKG